MSISSTTAAACAAGLAAALLGAAPAHAAPPANDDFDGATVAAALPYTDSSSTLEATRAADDPTCGSGGSIWYSFTAPADAWVEASLEGSDYDTYLGAYTGVRGELQDVACNDDYYGLDSRVAFPVTAGTTYHFLVSGFGGQTGASVFNLHEVPPPPPPLTSVALDVVKGSVDRRGNVTVIGTVVCDQPGHAYFYVSGQQTNRRLQSSGGSGGGSPCGTEPTTWSTTFRSHTGVHFVPGAITVNWSVDAYGQDYSWAGASGSEVLRLAAAR